jgi:hypothetical protein
MLINRAGATRLVIECAKVVIKIPNFTYSFENFLCGLLANIREGQTWRCSLLYEGPQSKSHWLCPVIFTSWGGWVLIMPKCDRVLTWEESELSYNHPCIPYFGGDDKPVNYGYLNGKIVKIDYGSIK